MPILQTPRGRFFYNETGSSGPVVYLLHGLTAKSEDWGTAPVRIMEAGFHVFAFDMRGHGRSERSGKDHSPQDHARDIAACAETLGHPRVHAVGHSTGGRNGLFFAALFPDKALSLTLIDQTLTADSRSWIKYRDRHAGFPTPFTNEGSLKAYLTKKFPGDEQRFRYYKGQFWEGQDGSWDWNFSPFAASETQRLGRETDSYGWLEKVKCPALFIKGGDSRYVPMEEAEKIRDLLPNGRLVVVEKAEHAVFRDNLEGFLSALLPFLKGIVPK